MSEQAAAKASFQRPGKTQQQIPPEKAQNRDTQGQEDDVGPGYKKAARRSRSRLQSTDRSFDYARDNQLQEIDRDKGQEPR
jgi:hypothetical protein